MALAMADECVSGLCCGQVPLSEIIEALQDVYELQIFFEKNDHYDMLCPNQKFLLRLDEHIKKRGV